MTVGSLLFGGVSRINVRRTHNRIAEEIKEYDVSEESCGDLLEFQRYPRLSSFICGCVVKMSS